MYVDIVPNRKSPPAILLRESWREGKKVRKRTVANLSSWPMHRVEALRQLLRGEHLVPAGEAFEIQSSLPHGHMAAVLGSVRRLKLERLLAPKRSRERDLVVAMIVARILDPRSKLATARGLDTATSSLAQTLGVEGATEDELYAAMDWLLARQDAIERKLAKRHLDEGSIVMCDVSSTYFEGRSCPLARIGYSRDGKKNKLQIVFGMLTDRQGRPMAVEVFEGQTGDPATLGTQITKLRERFGLKRMVLVGDRGLITQARIREELKPHQLDWITALRAPAIRKLVRSGTLQLSLFDQQDLAEITAPEYPGERLVVCKNPLLAEERARKREALLQATELELEAILTATQRPRRPLRGQDAIALRVGKVLGRFKVGKHFTIQIEDDSLSYERNVQAIAEEAALDGIYILRTTVPEEQLSAQDTVRTYKNLSSVERAFRSLKTVDLKLRPIYHRLAHRVRAHVLLCTLAYYVEWHMRRRLAPLLFDDENPEAGEASRSSPVAPAQRSPQAKRKAASKRTEDDLSVHSFQGLLQMLATLCKNRVQPNLPEAEPFEMLTTATPLQQRAFDLLNVSPAKM